MDLVVSCNVLQHKHNIDRTVPQTFHFRKGVWNQRKKSDMMIAIVMP